MTERPSIVIDLHPDTRQLLERLVVALERREGAALVPPEPSRASHVPDRADTKAMVESFPPFGPRRGESIRGASKEDLLFYANASIRELGDPSKRHFHQKERERLRAYNEELRRQGGEALPVPGDGKDSST